MTGRRPVFSGTKRELLERRLRLREGATAPAPAIARRPDLNAAVLSSAQRRMWFFDQLQPGSAVYNIPFALRLQGELNVPALRSAFAGLVARHEVLRTRYVALDGEPVARVNPPGAFALEEVDVAGAEPDAVNRVVQEECRRPFNLARDPVLRSRLFRLGPQEHVLTIVVHHIASDLWSWGILWRELAALYESGTAESGAILPELEIQYGDYAAAEGPWLKRPGVASQLDYWRRKLAGAPAHLELPTDRPRSDQLSFRGAVARRTVPATLGEALVELGRQEGATLFMTLLAAFQVLLARRTQQTDLVVGIPTAGRTLGQTEPLIGLFVNTLPLRCDLSGDPRFRGFLQHVKGATLEALSNQDVPFDRLVDELKPARGPGYAPLVQAMFTFQDAMGECARLPGLQSNPLPVDTGTARFDLALIGECAAGAIQLTLEYNTDLFDAETADRILGEYEVVLEGIVDDPERPVSRLPVLTGDERRRLLTEWNQTAIDFQRGQRLHELVEAQARRTPDAVAVVAGAVRLTYAELDARAERLAERLRAAGLAPERRVAIFLPRTAVLPVALLGVLKSGAAYVPLDPTYPVERIAFILEDCGAHVVLTERALLSALPTRGGLRPWCLDDPVGPPTLPPEGVSPVTAEDDLAYVIYTSGSTGKPKGVAVEHRNAVAFVQWAQTVFSRDDLGGVLAGTSVCFDLSIFELFATLSAGGKIILAENALALAALPAAAEVTLVNTVPSAAAELLRLGAFPPGVRTINLAGEALPQELVRGLYRGTSAERVYDLYGPTETTTYSTFALRSREGRPTIGRPIANTDLYLLDRHLQPVPIGSVGELFIGGAGVTRGYLNRPALTAERFVRNPFVVDPKARLYRTGDLCRYRLGGELEYLGRGDDQVKIRGFRVELGEVEAALRAHPGVADAAAAAREDRPGDKRLVAYAVARNPSLAVDELKAFLQEALPDAMIPAAILLLPSLPRTTNGKVDRKALPAPDLGAGPGAVRVAPRDELEAKLAAIWADVLGIDALGVNDRFFDLGGHSLLAVRLAVRIEREVGCKLPVSALFQAPTVAQLAGYIRAIESPSPPTTLLEIQPNGDQPPLFLVHGMGGGIMWGYANLANHLGTEQPVYAFKADESQAGTRSLSVPEMAAQYVADLRRLQPAGPYRIGGYCFGGNVAYEMARILEAQGERVSVLALISAWPANRGHERIRWSILGLVKFAINLGHWLARLRQWGPGERSRFFGWKLRTLARRMLRRWKPAPCGGPAVDLLVDLTDIPNGERRIWEAHLVALKGYRPGPYGGKVTLLRTESFPLFSSFDHDHGWSELAAGGAEVAVVPGRHETVLSEPHVASLAGALGSRLASRT